MKPVLSAVCNWEKRTCGTVEIDQTWIPHAGIFKNRIPAIGNIKNRCIKPIQRYFPDKIVCLTLSWIFEIDKTEKLFHLFKASETLFISRRYTWRMWASRRIMTVLRITIPWCRCGYDSDSNLSNGEQVVFRELDIFLDEAADLALTACLAPERVGLVAEQFVACVVAGARVESAFEVLCRFYLICKVDEVVKLRKQGKCPGKVFRSLFAFPTHGTAFINGYENFNLTRIAIAFLVDFEICVSPTRSE